jgi:dTDP-glucose pyrophosphorylase
METGELELTTVHIYIICLKAEVLSQLMAKWWRGLGGHGHLVEYRNFVTRQGGERLQTPREIRLDL